MLFSAAFVNLFNSYENTCITVIMVLDIIVMLFQSNIIDIQVLYTQIPTIRQTRQQAE